jgi:hypothetical protein
MSDESSPGPSFVRFEPPDILIGAFIGEITESEMRRICVEQRRITGDDPRIFVLFDLSRLGHVTPDARHAAAKELKGTVVRAAAYFGASFRFRVLATLVVKGINLMNRTSTPTSFFETEAEARAWISEIRANASASASASTGANDARRGA